MTYSFVVKFTLIEVVEVISSILGSATNSPAFKIVKSGPVTKSLRKFYAVSRLSIYFINRAW